MSTAIPDLGRNEPCHCGSGKKYKKCCESKDEQKERAELEKQHKTAAAKAKTETAETPEHEKPAQNKPATSAKPGPARHQTFTAPKFNIPRRTGGG